MLLYGEKNLKFGGVFRILALQYQRTLLVKAEIRHNDHVRITQRTDTIQSALYFAADGCRVGYENEALRSFISQ